MDIESEIRNARREMRRYIIGMMAIYSIGVTVMLFFTIRATKQIVVELKTYNHTLSEDGRVVRTTKK